TNHLELLLNAGLRWLNVEPPGQPPGRLFTAQVERLRATYTFTPRMFVRGIVQYVDTRRDLSLYLAPEDTEARTAGVATSALFAYKLNWQTVLFIGYGGADTFAEDTDHFEPEDRQFFLK